jgi:outer membrane protein insertion porin family
MQAISLRSIQRYFGTHILFYTFILFIFDDCLVAQDDLANSEYSIAPDNQVGPEKKFYANEVIIEGNRRVDTDAILQQLSKRSGEFSQEFVSEEVKKLYKTGFFDQVTSVTRSVVRPGAAVSQALVYTVVEKPVVRKVFIKGNNEIKESDLTQVINFGTKRFLDKYKLDTLSKNAESYYQVRGFYDAKVSYTIIPAEDNQIDVTFVVQEGKKFKIYDIEFVGLKKISASDLKEVIMTKRYKWWSSWLFGTGRLNREILENDKNIIKQFFLDHGFIDGTVSDPVIAKKKGKRLRIVFTIEEGPQYTVGQITASGDLMNSSQKETLESIKVETGEVFNASKIREDTFLVSEKFGDIGYAFVNVIPNTQIDRSSNRVNIEYTVSKGKKVAINKINIRGNEKTYDNVVRRELRVAERGLYSSSKIKRSETQLKRLGFFEEVNVSSEAVSGRDDQVDLNVSVREASTGTFTIGGGYSNTDDAFFNARISENNVFGTGNRIDLDAQIGQQRTNSTLSFLNPRVNDSFVSFGLDAFKSIRRLFDFDRDMTGGGVSFGYPLEQVFGESFQDVNTNVKYEFFNIDISNVDNDASQFVKNSAGSSSASTLTPQLIRNTIDNPINPNNGSRQIFSFEYAGLGGDQKYYVLEARNSFFYPFVETGFGNLVFSNRTSLGYGESNNDDPFPLFRRYFPGGINSVRGYDPRTLGPKDENGREFGGSKEFVNNAEVIFPLINAAGLKGVVFFDMGNAYDDNQSIDFGDLNKSYGFGFRWSSPIGPLRLEFGFPMDKDTGSKNFVPQFSFGAPLF